MNFNLLSKDPVQAHRDMIKDGTTKELYRFTKDMAIQYNIALDVFPKLPIMVDRWIMIGKLLSDEVVFGNNEGSLLGQVNYLSQGILRTHFRSAHLFRARSGEQVIRGGSLVNKHLLSYEELKGFKKLVKEYNKRVRERYSKTFEFISMEQWMKGEFGIVLTK